MVFAHLWIEDGLSALPGAAGMGCARTGSTDPAWHSFPGCPGSHSQHKDTAWEQGASLPHIPSSFAGETPPEQSFAELSFHGIPGGTRSPARSTHGVSPWRIPKEPCEKPVLQTGIKSNLPVPSTPKDWECRRGGWGWRSLI